MALVLSCITLPLVAGCGSGSKSIGNGQGGSTINPTTGITISPESITLVTGASQAFTASVTGSTNPGVIWSVEEGSNGGTITSTGVYTAPTSAGTYHVIATSVADSTIIAVAPVTVESPPAVTTAVGVSISPISISLPVGGTEIFSSTVTNSTNTAVTYSIEEGSAGGTVTAAGVYTAPSTAGTYHVVATSVADPAVSAMATVTVVPTVTITPATATIPIDGTQTFSATVNGLSDQDVAYRVKEGSAGGSISSSGVYTAPSTAGTYHVIATSVADSAVGATAIVTVQSGGSNLTVH